MMVLDAVSSEGSESTVGQLRLSALALYALKFPPDSLNLLMMLCTVEEEISKSLPILWGTLFLKNFNHFLTHLLANWRSSAHLCSWRARPFLDAAFVPNHDYNHLLTSPISNHFIFESFYLVNCPKLSLSQLLWECVAGLNGRNGYIFSNKMKLSYLMFILSAMQFKSN